MADRRLHLTIRGRVQGVAFRAYAREKARSLGLTGWVRNRADGAVELVAEGPRPSLDALHSWAQQGPPTASVDVVEPRWEEPTGELERFTIDR